MRGAVGTAHVVDAGIVAGRGEVLGEQTFAAWLPALACHIEIGVPYAMAARARQEGDGRAVGRPRGAATERLVGQAGERAAGEIQRPDGGGGPAPAFVAAVRGESDAPIGRPRGRPS